MINKSYVVLNFLVFVLVLGANATSIVKSKRSAIGSHYYYSKKILWNRKSLTYTLTGNVAFRNQTELETVTNVLKESFNEWEKNSCFSFFDARTSSLSADIKVIFTNDRNDTKSKLEFGHKNCDRRFRGAAAHAFFRNHKKYSANIHVNNEIFWMESKEPKGTISLKTVLLHEIGHVLGLYHSVDINSVMYENIFTNSIKKISIKDKENLEYLYRFLCK